jgi:hypothetical protein
MDETTCCNWTTGVLGDRLNNNNNKNIFNNKINNNPSKVELNTFLIIFKEILTKVKVKLTKSVEILILLFLSSSIAFKKSLHTTIESIQDSM